MSCCAGRSAGQRASPGLQSRWRLSLGRADLPTSLPLLGPELDRLLAGDLLAALEQRRLAGDQFATGELQRPGVAAVADGAEVQHLAAITEPALLGGERRPLAGDSAGVHGLLRPPPVPSPAAGSCRRSNPGSGW
jgi:hypothetical protein